LLEILVSQKIKEPLEVGPVFVRFEMDGEAYGLVAAFTLLVSTLKKGEPARIKSKTVMPVRRRAGSFPLSDVISCIECEPVLSILTPAYPLINKSAHFLSLLNILISYIQTSFNYIVIVYLFSAYLINA
jgi:hypothetical protein